ncbi:taste receptor, type 2, member 203 [Sinocyclocheilus rhinocerous]|uniref:Taste receptor type 2 n=1 Tax=Sinocyclocheilus rhinocerous TaxID=307959 RepID=A0A673KLS9_9TELE|nr:PREDICTED: taste receptor type 2 member 60 [Sinocyclocheilus rhinocerous]
MESWLYALLSSPLCLTATFFNIIFFFCLMRPVAGVTLRNPLCFLLIVVLFNSTFQQLMTALTIIMLLFDSPFWLQTLTRALIYQFFCANFSCNAWISIFYYISIVPQQHPIFIWIKRNINAILYVGFVLNQIVLLISLSMGTVMYFLLGPVPNNFTSLELNKTSPAESVESDLYLFHVANFTYLLYCTCPLFTLLFSWGKTFVYLREHLKKMGQSSESFSQPQQKSQMRVTVTGMVQAALFLPSSLWTITVAFLYVTDNFEMVDPNRFVTMTFCSMSSLGNLLCFGFSQSVFRHGIVSVFNKLKRHK